MSLGVAGFAYAEDPATTAEISRISAQLAAQQALLDTQTRQINEQRTLIDEQQRLLESMKVRNAQLDATRATGPVGSTSQAFATAPTDAAPATLAANSAAQPQNAGSPDSPVGQPPPEDSGPPVQLTGLPEGMAVLTPKGHFVAEANFEYDNASSNRLVFRGVEIVPGIQIGVIEANNADSNTAISTASFRYSPINRLELEVRAPFIDRHDRITTLAQRDSTISQTTSLRGDGVGDVEATARYQLNRGLNGVPVFVAGLRVKSDTGRGLYDVNFDANGVATELPTGSGFWAVEPSLTALYPTDPAVLFANVSYLFHLAKGIDKTFGDGVDIGRVDPGDSIGGAIGFGFSVNPRFSYSLGYRHNYIMATKTIINGTEQKSTSLQVGSGLLTMSYLFTPRLSISANFAFGVTSDAPNAAIGIRIPYVF